MALFKGLFSRPTKEEQEAVNWAAANARKSGDVGFAKVKGTNRLVSYGEKHGGIVHDKWMMHVREKRK